MDTGDLRIALFSGNYNYVRDGANQALNRLVGYLLRQGAAGSWALEHRATAMLNASYPLGFKLALHHKDLGIALETAQATGLELPISAAVRDQEAALMAQGLGDADVSALRRSLPPAP